MAALKNIRHEMFVREYIRNGGLGGQAYRKVSKQYPRKITGVNNPGSYRVVACQLRKRPDIQQREQELRDKMAKKSDITMEKVLTDIQEALNLARSQAKPNDMVNAVMAQAKLVGLLRDRVETGGVGDFDGMENISEILEKVREEAGPEAALALSKAFGLDNAETAKRPAPDPEEAAGLIDQPPPSDSVN